MENYKTTSLILHIPATIIKDIFSHLKLLPHSAADRHPLRCGDKVNMLFEAERIEQGATKCYI